ncbi:MAG: hypothetical protein R3F19_19025 [Verrucomicrobiales bacterium]
MKPNRGKGNGGKVLALGGGSMVGGMMKMWSLAKNRDQNALEFIEKKSEYSTALRSGTDAEIDMAVANLVEFGEQLGLGSGFKEQLYKELSPNFN